MTRGKTLDGAYDIEADTLTVNEASDLRGTTTVDGPAKFNQNIDLQNETHKIVLSASEAVEDYIIKLPPNVGEAGQILSTDGFGNSQWSTVATTPGSVSYIAISAPDGFMKVNGLNSDSTYTNKTFNLELSGALSIAYGGTGLSTTGSFGQVLTSNGSTLSWQTPFSNVNVTGPLQTTGGLTPTLSLSTVPVSLGGTGLTSVGSPGYLLSSNGTSLQWEAPNTFFGVESVTASVPLASSGGINPNVYIKDYTGVGDVVLKINPELITATLFNPTLFGANLNLNTNMQRITALPLEGGGFYITKPTGWPNQFPPPPDPSDVLEAIIYGLNPPLIPTDEDIIIENTVVLGEYPGRGRTNIEGAITLRTGQFNETFITNFGSTEISRLFTQLYFQFEDPFALPAPYKDGHPMKNIASTMFEDYDGNLGLRMKNIYSYVNASNAGLGLELKIVGSQYDGRYPIGIVDDDLIYFIYCPYEGQPNAPITIFKENGVKLKAENYGDINILSTGRGVFQSNYDMDIRSLNNLRVNGKNLYLNVRSDFKLVNDSGDASFLSKSYNFSTPVAATGGIDSYIAGTIAWNAVKDFEALALDHIDLKGWLGADIFSGQGIGFMVDNVGFSFGKLGILDIVPVAPNGGNIVLTCQGKFFVPLVGAAFGDLVKTPVGGIYLKASETGQISLKAGGQGVYIETVEYTHTVAQIPTGSA